MGNKGKKIKFAKKAVVILAVGALILAVGVYSCSIKNKSKGIHTNITTTTLTKTTLQDVIAVSGTVHSNETYNVYTTLAYPVKTIQVDVGDKVKKGDVLAVLDTATLEQDIEQQEYAVADSHKSAALSLAQGGKIMKHGVSLLLVFALAVGIVFPAYAKDAAQTEVQKQTVEVSLDTIEDIMLTYNLNIKTYLNNLKMAKRQCGGLRGHGLRRLLR
jgi:multidrug efflux pump subunit AcrA (membrane-fusion protein)